MRIFVVDDDPLTREVVGHQLLERGHEVVPFPDGEASWEALEEGPDPDMIILDWVMPGMSGPDLLRKVRARPGRPYVYIVMLTQRSKPEDLTSAFEAGADDFLVKPYAREELEARLRAGQRIVELQNELISAREALRAQAMHDSLTGMLNHGAIMDALSGEVARAHREANPLSLILADLDEFKRVNDRYGHLAGDRVLTEAARRMRGCLRSYDAVGRYGGEEFLLVLPNCGPDEAARLADRVRLAVSAEPVRANGIEITVTVSQGAVTWTEPQPIPVDRLIRPADEALYFVKHGGRNAVKHVLFEWDPADQPAEGIPGGKPGG